MFVLTNLEDKLDGGLYATTDGEGNVIVQVFVDKDDAVCYNTHLEAIDQGLFVTELEETHKVEKLCELMGYAYTIVDKGQVVVPRIETLQSDLGLL